MAHYHDVLLDFLKGKFGASMGERLLHIYLKKSGMNDIRDLDAKTQHYQQEFIQNLLQGVFGDFYSAEKIFRINITCLLRFALEDAAERIEQMIGLPAKFSEFELTTLSGKMELESDFFSKEKYTFINFMAKGAIQGYFLTRYDKEIAQEFAKLIITKMQNIDEEQVEMTADLTDQALSEFYNILIPTFTDVVTNTLNVNFFFEPYNTDETRAFIERAQPDDISSINRVYVKVKVKKEEYESTTLFVFVKADAQVLKMLQENVEDVSKKQYERIPITARKSGDTVGDMQEFLTAAVKQTVTGEMVRGVASKLDIDSIYHMTEPQMARFVTFVLEKWASSATDYTKNYIEKNLRFLAE